MVEIWFAWMYNSCWYSSNSQVVWDDYVKLYTTTNRINKCITKKYCYRSGTAPCTNFTETLMDYGGTTTLFMFEACDKMKCINVTIEDDNTVERTEFFNGHLNKTANFSSRITLNPDRTRVDITDNDGRQL